MYSILCRSAVFLIFAAALVHADVLHWTGTLDPALNSDLVFWDQYAPGYTIPVDAPYRALNIAVHSFAVGIDGPVTFSSDGYSAGGFDSVLAVFQGTGNTAAYVTHRYAPFGPGDFSFDLGLVAGAYTLSVSMFMNEPCASGPCVGSGTFGDGYTNLAPFDDTGLPLTYDVTVTTSTTAVPEPSSLILLSGVLAAMFACSRRRIFAR